MTLLGYSAILWAALYAALAGLAVINYNIILRTIQKTKTADNHILAIFTKEELVVIKRLDKKIPRLIARPIVFILMVTSYLVTNLTCLLIAGLIVGVKLILSRVYPLVPLILAIAALAENNIDPKKKSSGSPFLAIWLDLSAALIFL